MSNYREINKWDPKLKVRNVYGYAGRPSGRGYVTAIWNPYKYRIIMETHFRFPPDIDFYYFSEGMPYYCLYLFRDSKIKSGWQLMNIGKTLIHLNPELSYNEFASLMYELVHPSYPYTDHFKVKFKKGTYEKILQDIYQKREKPKPLKIRKFFFNEGITWYENERQGIIKRVASPMFGAEDEMDKTIREAAKDIGFVKHQYLADLYSCSLTTIRKILRQNPHLRNLIRRLNAEHKEKLKAEKQALRELEREERNLNRPKVKRRRKNAKPERVVPEIRSIVNDYWRKRRRLPTEAQVRVELRKMNVEATHFESKYYLRYYIKKLKSTKKYKVYMLKMKGEGAYNEKI